MARKSLWHRTYLPNMGRRQTTHTVSGLTFAIGQACILAAVCEGGIWTGSLNWESGRREMSRPYHSQGDLIRAAESAYQRASHCSGPSLERTVKDVDLKLWELLSNLPPNPRVASAGAKLASSTKSWNERSNRRT